MQKGITSNRGRMVILLAACFLFVSSLMGADNRKVKKMQQPPYPPLALKMRVAGTVRLEATVDASGGVEDVRVVSGHPLLKSAAAECVKQWSFESGSKSVEVVELIFRLPN